MTRDTLPGSPALDDRLARWVGLGAACAVLLLIVLFAGWAASLPGGLLAAVPAVSRFELREVAPGDPDGRGPGGRLVEARERLALPAFIRTDGDQSLHRAVFEIDLDPFIGPEDGFDPARDGDTATAHRPPAKSLVLSQAINGADIYLNGVWINGLAQSSARARFMWFRPLVVELPRKLLRRDGPNRITLEVNSWEPYFTIAPVLIGPADHAAYVAESIHFLCRTLANASRGFCLLAGLFMVGVWLANRSDPAFGLLGAASLIWAAVYTLSLWIYMPAGWRPAWLWAFYLCAGALNVLLIQFILRYIDQPLSRRALTTLVAISAGAATVWPFLGQVVEWDLDMFWIWVLVPFQAWAILRLARHAWRTRSSDAVLLLVVVLAAGALILHDYNVLMQLVRRAPREDDGTLMRLLTAPIYLTHLALPPLLIVMARVHLAKFRVSVEHVREANRILAEALRRREMELAVSHARQRDLERGEAAQEERERIYSELHDGIGSKLVRTIFSVRDGRLDRDQVERGLLEVLQGVREVISETDTTEHRPIQDILFDYGVDLDALLSAPDFQVSYDIENDRECVLLGGLSKEVMRIVEESVANTLKYARASRLNLSLRLDGDLLVVVVEDDGQSAAGPAPAVRPAFGTSTGQGLINMRERARRMGGEYRFERGPDGARSTLTLPLVAAVAAPRHEVVAPR